MLSRSNGYADCSLRTPDNTKEQTSSFDTGRNDYLAELTEEHWGDDFKDADNNDVVDQENYDGNLLNQPVKRIKLDLDNLKWSVDDEGH